MIARIDILGPKDLKTGLYEPIPIGKYEEDGVTKGISLLDVITQVKSVPQGTRILEVHICSPGGLVEEGDNIYNYLESLQREYVVNTVQDGPIASIATKLFAVGMDRKADPSFGFLIHNPWNDPGPGDSNHQEANLEQLVMEEDKLRKFYSKKFNITEEGLAPLMDAETEIPGNLLLKLGIATSVKTNIKVMAMKKEGAKEETLAQKISALYKKVTGKEIKAEGSKALDLDLADGSKLSIDAPDAENLLGAAAMKDGQPAPDGDYPTAPDESGMSDVITVAGGLVTAVTEQPAASTIPMARIEALEKNIASLVEAVSGLVESNKTESKAAVEASKKELESAFEGKMVALRAEIGTTHNPKKAATVYAESVDKESKAFRSIAQVMSDKAQSRTKQLNG